MKTLPIDQVIPDIQAALSGSNRLVLQAPPGAGKTTAVPLALLDAPWLERGQIIMLEPRRLAARSAAARMAQLLGEKVGETVGYHIRADKKVSQKTKLLVVTEGILTRYLQNDPALESAALLIFDEFHERNLHADLGLALALQSQEMLRDDLKLLVMSATLNTRALCELLDAPLISSEGRCYPVENVYLPHHTARPERKHLAFAVARQVLEALKHESGSILVFLPGAGEIRQVEERLRAYLAEHRKEDVSVAPLYGDLGKEAQDAAISPAPEGMRKVVLATNIAETSLTIEGVSIVIDSGLQRVSRFSPATGMDRLETLTISQDAADQRSGRAGRTGPGKCYRLWHEHTHLSRHQSPDILSSDLTPMVLDLALWGVESPDELRWLDLPIPAAVQHAKKLLARLGAVDEKGKVTEHGRTLSRLGLHPRLAHMLLRASEVGCAYEACLVAALLSERNILKGSADIVQRLELLFHRETEYPQVIKSAKEFVQRLGGLKRPAVLNTQMAGVLLGFAYPERIAKSRGVRDNRYLLSGGRGAILKPDDELVGERYLAVGDLDGAGNEARIYLAAALNEMQIEECFGELISEERRVSWNNERVEARVQRLLGAIVLEERYDADVSEEQMAQGLCEGIRSKGLEALNWSKEAVSFKERVRFLETQKSSNPAAAALLEETALPDFSDKALLEGLEHWLMPHLSGLKSLKACQNIDLLNILKMYFSWELQQRIDVLAPAKISVPSGSRIAIDYSDPQTPVLAVRLQELFGLTQTPSVLGGVVPLTLHLLSPAYRPMQVTRDLKSFWDGAYHEVKKELRGKYKKHYWPDDPLEAEATSRTKKRM